VCVPDRRSDNLARYDRMSRFYEPLTRFASFGTIGKLYRAVGEALDLAPVSTVLEFGCGPATVTPVLRDAVGPDGQVIGVDISEKMLEKARAKAERNGWTNVRFECSDIHGYEAASQVDAVVFCLALSGFPDTQACLEKALSMLGPGGQLVVLDSIPKPEPCLANFVIRAKDPMVGAVATRLPLEFAEKHMTDLRTRSLSGGVYTVLSARKPVGP
jgi:ubiquinone/menaquinone biosynthesis C-methylase UbiE